jgi:hypothetical protein
VLYRKRHAKLVGKHLLGYLMEPERFMALLQLYWHLAKLEVPT